MTRENIEAAVGVAFAAARMHEASVSLSELAQLMPENTETGDLVSAFESLPGLREGYRLKEGYVFNKNESHKDSSDVSERHGRAVANIKLARAISSRLGREHAVVMAVSGSASYGSASVHDDIDLFCVTPRGRMWIFLTKALVLSRAFHILKKSSRSINISCVMDEEYAEALFSTDQGPLFARDALMAEVIHGHEAYEGLLEAASWMRCYFPRLYGLKRHLSRPRPSGQRTRNGGVGLVNLLLYHGIGSYVQLKTRFHNRLLSKGGKTSSLFVPRIGLSHLVYESKRYLALKSLYSSIGHVD